MENNKSISNKLKIVNHPKRPNSKDYISKIFPNFIEMHGDRYYGDDTAIIGGIASLVNIPVTVIGQMKGHTIEENIKYNFSMCHPEGYRKALRLMRQAEKFKRPIICFIDTLGAYPGVEAEERGQALAISDNLKQMFDLKVPIISILIGNGVSGGALALAVANEIAMLENALFSIISPKGCANILWKNSTREVEAAQMLKMTAEDIYRFGISDRIINEPVDGAHKDLEATALEIKEYLCKEIKKYKKYNSFIIKRKRYKKYRNVGRTVLYNE